MNKTKLINYTFDFFFKQFIILLLITNVMLPGNLILFERLFIFSFVVWIFFIWHFSIWKTKIFNIYFLLIGIVLFFESNLIFLFLNLMTIVFLALLLYRIENKNFYINMLLLNIFFLSIVFLTFKFFLLLECVALDSYLYFDLNSETSRIAVEVNLKNSYVPYPEDCYKIVLSKVGFHEQINFLTKDLSEISVEVLFFLHWLCIFTDYLPFVDIALVVSK